MRTLIKTWWPWALCLLLDALLVAGAYWLGRAHGRVATSCPYNVVEVRSDTVRRVDTVTVRKPVAVRSEVVRWVQVPVDITLDEADSLYAAMMAENGTETPKNGLSATAWATVPVEQKVYSDSLYTAWVSGCRPSLDSIRLRIPTVTVRQTVTRKPRYAVGPSVGAGYGIFNRKPDIYIGFSLTLHL